MFFRKKTRLDRDVERCARIIDHSNDNNHSDVYLIYTLYMFFQYTIKSLYIVIHRNASLCNPEEKEWGPKLAAGHKESSGR